MYIYIYVYICVCIYIYIIYIYREREREVIFAVLKCCFLVIVKLSAVLKLPE